MPGAFTVDAVRPAIKRGTDRAHRSVGNAVEIAFVDSPDAFVAADPQTAMPVFENVPHHVIRQALCFSEPGEAAVLEPRDSAAKRPDPQGAFRVLVDRSNEVTREAILLRGLKRRAGTTWAHTRPELAHPLCANGTLLTCPRLRRFTRNSQTAL